MILLKEKPKKLFKVKAQLREDYLGLKWRDRMILERRNADWAAMYGLNSQIDTVESKKHNNQSYIMQTSGLVKHRWKATESSKDWRVDLIRRAEHWDWWELRNYGKFVMKRRKELDSWEQTTFMPEIKKNLPRWIRCCLRSGSARQGERLEWRKIILRSRDSEQFWNVPRSQSQSTSRIPSPRGMLCPDSGLPQYTRNSMGTFGNVFESPSAPERIYPSLTRDCHETWRRIATRTAKFNNTDSTIFQEYWCLEF